MNLAAGIGRTISPALAHRHQLPEDLRAYYLGITRHTQDQFFAEEARRVATLHRLNNSIAVTRCGDGRMLSGKCLGLPLGSYQPYRFFGSVPPLFGLSTFQDDLIGRARRAQQTSKKQGLLLPVMLHESGNDRDLGCAFHNCDKTAAFNSAMEFVRNIECLPHTLRITPVLAKYDTDDGKVYVFSAQENQWISLAHLTEADICRAFAKMNGGVVEDLLVLAEGHRWFLQSEIAAHLAREHCERIFVMGGRVGGADLTTLALVVDHRFGGIAESARVGIGVLRQNLLQDPTRSSRALLLPQVPFDDTDMRGLAEISARNIVQTMRDVAHLCAPDVFDRLDFVPAIVDSDYTVELLAR